MSSNGTSNRGGGRGGAQQVARVITSAAWDLRLKRCEVAKGDLNEVTMIAVFHREYVGSTSTRSFWWANPTDDAGWSRQRVSEVCSTSCVHRFCLALFQPGNRLSIVMTIVGYGIA